jgi:phage gpG-like protein
MRPAFNEVHERFLKLEKRQFDTQGAATGERWAPLAPSTRAYKAAHGLDPRILHATLRLRRSLTQSGDSDHVYHVSPDEALMASSVPYGMYHQSRAARTRLPRRPPVVIPDRDKQDWMKVLQRHIVGGS